jgi:hypothetical protein
MPAEEAITEPLPIRSVLGNPWPVSLLPLCVLYSPLLRLRFRQAFASCCQQVNDCCGRPIFDAPQEASNKLAVEIENFGIEPPLGIVYVRDREGRKATEGTVQIFHSSRNEPYAAIVRLPESEDSPYSTVGVTMQQICQLLGLTHYGNDISKENVAALRALYQ